MMKNLTILFMVSVLFSVVSLNIATARDKIVIVGSSTVWPFATAVAERFGRNSLFKTPIVEANGTGGGMKLFCSGLGTRYPDIVNASRRIEKGEFDRCSTQGISIVEIEIGFDGIIVSTAASDSSIRLNVQHIFQALGKQIPVDGHLVDNPYRKWKDIDASFPDVKIEMFGPPSTSGTRDAFIELVMQPGAMAFSTLRQLASEDRDAFQAIYHRFREDGLFIEVGENDNLILQKLKANTNAFGILGFSFMDQNISQIKGIPIQGIEPTFDHIVSGDYGVTRSLYVYVKKEHVGIIPGLKEYIKELTSEDTWGDEGYLVNKGLIPLPAHKREIISARARQMIPMTREYDP